MRVSAKIDYAIRALVEIAARRDERVSGKQIADAQAIPDKFLTNIMTELAGHGLVRTQRGTLGGYWLGRPSEAITLADIIYAIDGSLTNVRGSQPEDLLYENAAEPLRDVWIAVQEGLRRVLEAVTLADLVNGTLPAAVADLASHAVDPLHADLTARHGAALVAPLTRIAASAQAAVDWIS